MSQVENKRKLDQDDNNNTSIQSEGESQQQSSQPPSKKQATETLESEDTTTSLALEQKPIDETEHNPFIKFYNAILGYHRQGAKFTVEQDDGFQKFFNETHNLELNSKNSEALIETFKSYFDDIYESYVKIQFESESRTETTSNKSGDDNGNVTNNDEHPTKVQQCSFGLENDTEHCDATPK